jgi:hypothetical protein
VRGHARKVGGLADPNTEPDLLCGGGALSQPRPDFFQGFRGAVTNLGAFGIWFRIDFYSKKFNEFNGFRSIFIKVE